MGKPGAKKNDQIVSATPGDVHIIMIPSPGGPVPTPIPHPCASIINDKVAEKVKVMGQPGAVKGSKSKHTPPHVPMGPGPFQKPPKNEGEIITGSANVFYEGKEAAMLGDTGQMCSDPSDTPVGKVMGTAAMVMIGGGGSGGDAERADASARAMAAASAACHKWINANLPPGPEREQAHRDLCTATGHPVDVATGKLFTKSVDLRLPGRIPFEFVRNYSSSRPELGPFGWGWRHSYQIELIVTAEFVAHRDANGRLLSFAPIQPGQSSSNLTAGLVLRRSADAYWVDDASGLTQKFRLSAERAAVHQLESIEDPYGNRVQFSYESGRLSDIHDAAGRRVRLEYDGRGRIRALLLQNPANAQFDAVRVFAFNEENDLIEVRDIAQQTIRYEYANHLLVRETDRNGFSFYFRYDREGWCRETWGEGGILHRALEYDRPRRCTRVSNSEGKTGLYYWNEQGLVETEIDACGNRWTFQYDEHQHKLAIRDPLGNAWSYEYDEAGRLVARADPEGNVFAIQYDERGRRTFYVDATGRAWPIRYNETGQIASLADPGSNAVEVLWSEKGDLIGVTDELGRRTSYRYDAAGNMVERKNKQGLLVERGYDFSGRLLHETDPLGARVQFEYDALGRVTVERWRGRGSFTYEHDAEGNVTKGVDPFGLITLFEYGRFNKLLRRIVLGEAGRSEETRLEYDSENRLKALVYPGARRVEYGYDDDGRVSWKRSVDGREVRYVRDAAGFVVEMHDRVGLVATYQNDRLGRVVKKATADGEEVSYKYDERGNLVGAANGSGAIQMELDAFGRVTAESGAHGAFTHQYDPAGRHVRSTFGEDFSYALERAEEVVTLRASTGSVSADYDIYGRLGALNFSNGAREQFSYQTSRRPESVTSRKERRTYQYDSGDCITGIQTEGGARWKFDRDRRRRLVAASRNGASAGRVFRFHYDEQGNRSREGEGFTFGAGNRLHGTGSEILKYDGRGCLVERCPRDGLPTRYRYSPEGFLLEVARGEDRTLFCYDALCRRVSKISNGRETRYAWEGSRLAYETRPDGEERYYLYRPGSYVPLMCQRRLAGGAWQPFFYHTDHRGCPEAVTNGAGEEVWRAVIGPFGEVEDQQGSFDQPIALPGQYRDVETGLVYNYLRYFDPHLTIFITPDPIGHLGGEQLYAFAADPVMKVDPLGLSADDYDQSQATPHRIVEINGVKYVEFEASRGFTSGGNINPGGSGVGPQGSPDAMASIGPNGEVVVMEGRHRAVAAAAGDPIPEDLGGIPGKPGHLRYPLGEGGDYETTQNVGPSLGGLASDPAKLDAARSGQPGRRTT